MSWLAFALAVLATYRIAHMLTREDGPFDVFSQMREVVGQDTWVGRGLHCVLCVSFWLSLPAAWLADLPIVLGWLGVAGGVMVTHKLFDRIGA